MMEQRQQATHALLMIRPARFGFNSETAISNIFQKSGTMSQDEIQNKALEEFDALVKLLRSNKIYVIVLQDDGSRDTPDSIFPNNWISFEDGKIVLYPMLAESRRRERRASWIQLLKQFSDSSDIVDFTNEELSAKFLEGTGSMVLDRVNRIAFANISSRTNAELFNRWCMQMNFEPVMFRASTKDGNEIYHTNVLMAIGNKVAVFCPEVIGNVSEQKLVIEKLSSNHQLIEITEEQMNHFCGNLLLVKNRDGKTFWVMSDRACQNLLESQKKILQLDGELLCSNLKTIESIGGGSARCTIAEIF